MLLTQIQVQIVSAIFLGILEVTYFRRRKIPILVSRIFSSLMITAILYMICDFGIVLCKIYTQNIPSWCSNLCQQWSAVFITALLMLIYLYISIYNSEEQKLKLYRSFIAVGLFAISVGFTFVSLIIFLRKGVMVYNLKWLEIAISIVLGVYSLVIIINAVKYRCLRHSFMAKRKEIYVLWTMVFWIITVVNRMVFKNDAILSLGITSMIFIMYLGLETPDEYIDQESEALNATALKLVLQEKMNRKKEFFIINLDIEELHLIENTFGEEIKTQLCIQITNFLSQKFHTDVYHAKPHSFTFLIPYFPKNKKAKKYDVDLILTELEKRMEQEWLVENHSFILDSHCDFLFYPTNIPENMTARDVIEFTDEWHSYSEERGFVRRVNAKLIENKQRQEQILKIVQAAIENNGIEMYFQPIYNIQAQKFTNSESLVRLKDKETIGFISPEEFIPMAEKNGLIMSLSDRIFEQVFDFLNKNKDKLKGVEHVEVNLSGLQSVDADLPELMSGLLKYYNIKPESINLEITESTAITSGYMLKKNMDALKKIGCTFSMDDFGTGYSNLSQMAKIDYELIKIDKSLLWPCFDEKNEDKDKAKILLENMISMILKMGMKIVVEGVENKEQYDYLANLGVTYIQGYYFSKPLCMNDYLAFLEENNK